MASVYFLEKHHTFTFVIVYYEMFLMENIFVVAIVCCDILFNSSQ